MYSKYSKVKKKYMGGFRGRLLRDTFLQSCCRITNRITCQAPLFVFVVVSKGEGEEGGGEDHTHRLFHCLGQLCVDDGWSSKT